MDMIGVGVVLVALCIVSLLVRVWFRAVSFPPNARLLCDAWEAVEQKMGNDDTLNNTKTERITSEKHEE
jgi:hypothetical protein